MTYISLLIIVFGFNLMPAFAPPTWSVLVLFKINSNVDPIALVGLGALAAGSGRYCLARLTSLLRHKISAKQRDNLEAARILLTEHSGRNIAGLALFAISPVPSAQLFEAAGLIRLKLLPLTLAFFSGRIVSYSLYVAGAGTLAAKGFGDLMKESITSPWGIAFQIALIYGIYLLLKVDWLKMIKRGD
ncbi:MAG: hypothetical protein RL414_508 [Actinomycetota bacterium]